MPWFNLRDMSDSDLLAVYRCLKYLGPLGESAPAYVPLTRNPRGHSYSSRHRPSRTPPRGSSLGPAAGNRGPPR